MGGFERTLIQRPSAQSRRTHGSQLRKEACQPRARVVRATLRQRKVVVIRIVPNLDQSTERRRCGRVRLLPDHGNDRSLLEGVNADEHRADRLDLRSGAANDRLLPGVEVPWRGLQDRTLEPEEPRDRVVQMVNRLAVPGGLDDLDSQGREDIGKVFRLFDDG